MDGGIDAAYRSFFGSAVETRIREAIGQPPRRRYLPLAASLVVVRTGHTSIPYLIVAPDDAGARRRLNRANCYRAMRAVLRVATPHEGIGRAVFCPGFGHRDWRGAG